VATNAAFTYYLANKLLQHVSGKVAYPAPKVYLALTLSPGSNSTRGSEVSTTVWSNYARQALSFGTADNGIMFNDTLVDFGSAVIANGGSVSLTNWEIYDAPVGGNSLVFGDFTMPMLVGTGTYVQVPVGGISVALD
jgi:hypothetical protein